MGEISNAWVDLKGKDHTDALSANGKMDLLVSYKAWSTSNKLIQGKLTTFH
jgi:hypothetical protein